MLQCAAAEPGMFVDNIDVLDSNNFHLGCENGVVDLRTEVRFLEEPLPLWLF
jgi:phage/plasmid-associated DNA primase